MKAKTFAEALEILNDDLSALNEAVDVAVAQALTTFAEGAERDARAALNRPHWLLSRRIDSKVKQYRTVLRRGKAKNVAGIPDNMARAFDREVARVAAGQKVKG